jgi:polar amino acid transport system substrate-binding protein
MKVECEFVTQDWDGIIPALLAGKFDAIIASMSITEERKEKVDFTNKYYNTPPAIAVPKDSPITEASDAGLAGKMLGAQSSTTHSNYAEEKLPLGRAEALPDPGRVQARHRFRPHRRGDRRCHRAVRMAQVGRRHLLQAARHADPDPVINGEGAGIAIRKGETELRDMFNEAIAAIRANGTYKEINDKYFDVDVYGD